VAGRFDGSNGQSEQPEEAEKQVFDKWQPGRFLFKLPDQAHSRFSEGTRLVANMVGSSDSEKRFRRQSKAAVVEQVLEVPVVKQHEVAGHVEPAPALAKEHELCQARVGHLDT